MKTTSLAPANIAFIKYWGKKDAKLRLPYTSTISMNLDKAQTTTTVEFSSLYKKDEIYFGTQQMEEEESSRVIKHLDRLRNQAKSSLYAKVVTQNNFPRGAGIASSASGFAALTLAASIALGLKLSQKELSILARLGSGSACRSIPDGFVEWIEGKDSSSSYAYSIYPPNYWQIRDVLAVVYPSYPGLQPEGLSKRVRWVDTETNRSFFSINQYKKKTSSTKGHESAETSPFFSTRLKNLPQRIKNLKSALQKKDFSSFGHIIEAEAVEMHTIMMTQTPPLFYWNNITMDIIHAVQNWRDEGLPVYFTIDAGPNIHMICQQKDEQKVIQKAKSLTGINNIIVNKPAQGAHLTNKHLF